MSIPEYSTTDQPEIVNKPTIHYNRQSNEFDARGIPKIGNLQDTYQKLYEELFFALDKCYFIKNEPYKIIHEIDKAISFEHTKTQRQVVLSKEKIYQMMNKSYQEGNSRYREFSLWYFWYWELGNLQHKLEIDQLSLQSPETKEIILQWYHNIFDNLKEWQYPSDQRWVNTLFYMSILLDFDKEIQKNLTKYFINNALNTLYREDDHHYWFNKQYNEQQIWSKIGLSIEWKETERDYDIYLSIEDCKKIADRTGLTPEELSDVLYDVCLFKLGDDSKASASFHRKTKYGLEDIKKYLLWDQKTYIENLEYIWENWRDHHTQMMYNMKPYDIIKANELLWVSLQDQRNKVENEQMTYQKIRHQTIQNIGKDTFEQYTNHKRDIDIDKYDETHQRNIKDNCVYLVEQGEIISLTDNIEWKDILGSIKLRLWKTWSHNYDHKNNKALFYGTTKYEADIFSSPNMPKEYVYTVIEIFRKQYNIMIDLHSLNFWNEK